MGNAKLHAKILELENKVKQQEKAMEEDKLRTQAAGDEMMVKLQDETKESQQLRARIEELEAQVKSQDDKMMDAKDSNTTIAELEANKKQMQSQLDINAFKISKLLSDQTLNIETIKDYIGQIKVLEEKIHRKDDLLKEKMRALEAVGASQTRHIGQKKRTQERLSEQHSSDGQVTGDPEKSNERTETLKKERDNALAAAEKGDRECERLEMEVLVQKEQLDIYAGKEIVSNAELATLRQSLESLKRLEHFDQGTMTENNAYISVGTSTDDLTPPVVKPKMSLSGIMTTISVEPIEKKTIHTADAGTSTEPPRQRLTISPIMERLSLAPIDIPPPPALTTTHPFTFFGVRIPLLGIDLPTLYLFLLLFALLALLAYDYSSLRALRAAYRNSNQFTRELVVRGRNMGLRQTGGYWLMMLVGGEEKLDKWRFGVEGLLGLNGVWDG